MRRFHSLLLLELLLLWLVWLGLLLLLLLSREGCWLPHDAVRVSAALSTR